MKSTSSLLKFTLPLLLTLSLGSMVQAGDYPFPAAEPAFTVTLPDDWVIGGANGNISATSPDKSVSVYFWKPALAQMSTVVGNAERHASPVLSKFEQIDQVIYRKRVGIDFQCIYGTGVLQGSGTKVDVTMSFFAAASGTVYGVARVSTEIGKEINQAELNNIVGSIRPYVK